ncbi:MAG: SirB1 family protein [Ktedonobacterales bacterium]
MDESALHPSLRFSAFAALPEERMRLDEGALLIAELAYPRLPHAPVLRRLDALARDVRAELAMAPDAMIAPGATGHATAVRVLRALRDVLAGREGFHGNQDAYFDPHNSFLNDVLDRRTGLPISLGVVYLEVARRLGAPLAGVSLPAHFVVKWPLPAEEGGDIFLDAFRGAILDADTCRRFVLRLLAAQHATALLDARWFAPVGTRVILTRLLANLKQAYLQAGETARALTVVDRLVVLRPDLPAELRDRGLLRLALGETLLAAADLATYASRAPDAPEIHRLQRRLGEIQEVRAKLN